MNQDIPEALKKLAGSPEIYDSIEKIGKEFDLHIDQIGELDAEVRKVMLGLSKSTDFVKNAQELLEIDGEKSKQIAERINAEIFSVIKTKLQTEVSDANTISSIENAGGFSVEPALPEKENNVTYADRDKILANLENPVPSKETVVKKGGEETFTEPLADHLLNGMTARPEQKTATVHTEAEPPANLPTGSRLPPSIGTPPVAPKINPPTPNVPPPSLTSKPKIDPYREAI